MKSTSPRAYLAAQLGRDYAPGRWDCARLALGWLRIVRPEGAVAAARLLEELGYSDDESDQTLARVYARAGSGSAAELGDWLYVRLRAHLHPAPRTRPGDFTINRDNLAFGVVDEDYQAAYLGKTGGYSKWPVRPGDALLRAL